MSATKSMLLSIWDLEKEDETVIDELFSSSGISLNYDNHYRLVRPHGIIEEYQHNDNDSDDNLKPADCSFYKYCTTCSSMNDGTLSWCIECGTCLFGEGQKKEEIDCNNETDLAQEKEVFSKVLQEDKLEDSLELLSLDEKKTNGRVSEEHEMIQDDIIRSSSDPFTRLSPQKYTRKWRTSSSAFYMWQKPSSLTGSISPSNNKVLTNNDHKEQCQLERSFLDLPDELLLFILSLLSFTDLITCSYVCKRLYHVASDSTLYGKEITLNHTMTLDVFRKAVSAMPSSLTLKKCNHCLTIREVNEAFAVLGTKLKKLVIDTCQFGHIGSSNFVLLTALAQYCPHLISLELQWIMIGISSGLVQLMENCTKLEELKLIDVSDSVPMDWIKVAASLSKLPNLKTLHIALYPELSLREFVSETHQYCFPSLKTLTMRQNKNTICLGDVHKLLNFTAPNLKSLKLECIKSCSDIVEYLEGKGVSITVC